MKSYRIVLLGLLALLAASCGKNTSIQGTLTDAPGRKLAVKFLDVNVTKTLDTVQTNASGAFRYALDVQDGQPLFVYLYDGDTKVASLLLRKGDKVTVTADTLGHYTVTGSEESARLQQVEQDFSAFLTDLAATIDASGQDGSALNREISRKYVDYYRKALRYVVANPYSLTTIPVLYQKINEGFPIFKENTDAIYFRSVCDSLKTVWPESGYVKALEKEAARRTNLMELGLKMQNAQAMSFPDLEMPNSQGGKSRLSEVDAKVILVMFWNAADAAQKMFNIDQLLPLYREYHPKGFEIYAVNVDADKTLWGTTVRNQQLPWINVCDGFGAASVALQRYNVTALPAFYLIAGGELVSEPGFGIEGLKGYLKKNL
ncbi:MAG: redoxin domain-containing protein [Bacteroidales bacterium]|nr:redoxin domain-containing protein [Bacteroidales bacterium]